MTKPFERHHRPQTAEDIQKLKQFVNKGMGLTAIAKALTHREEA